jgi:hypothetical protein
MKFPNLYPFYRKLLFITLFLLPVSLAAQVVIWSEDFTYPNGTTDDPPKWTSTGTNCDSPPFIFSVQNNEFVVNEMEGAPCCGGPADGGGNDNRIETETIDISGYCDVSFSLMTTASGGVDCTVPQANGPVFGCSGDPNIDDFHDQISVEYELDGTTFQGPYVCGQDSIGLLDVTGLQGSTLVIRVFVANKFGSETYTIDDIIVEGIEGDPAVLTNVQDTFCVGDPAYNLPIAQDTFTGNWSGPGIMNNQFDPGAVGVGSYTVTYTPNPPGCAAPVDTVLVVTPLPDASWTTPSLCFNGAPVTLSPDPTAEQGGTWSGTGVTDNGDGTATFDPSAPGAGSVTYSVGVPPCNSSLTQTIPITTISFSQIGTPFCDDNGTPTDPTDDVFFIPIAVSGTNLGPDWTLNDPPYNSNITGNYNTLVDIGPYPISGGNVTITVTDNGPLACETGPITFGPPATCSDQCLIDNINFSQASTPCDNNGTPSDPSDDLYLFSLNPIGNGLTGTYTVSINPGTVTPSSGAYGAPTDFALSGANPGLIAITVTDDTNPSCASTTFRVIQAAVFPCSNACELTDAGLSNVACNDNGTPSDPSDDFIILDLNPTGGNLGSGYNVSVSSGSITPASGSYGSTTSFSLNTGSAGAGDITLTITDTGDNACTIDTLVLDPGSCSPECALDPIAPITATCNDNGTPSDPSDDFLEFSLNPTGSNLSGSGYTVSVNTGSVTPGSGNYGSPTGFSLQPGSAGAGNVTLTVTDIADPNCSQTLTITDPGSCSNQCIITATVANISCDDNGTPSDPSDDTFFFDITVTGSNTGGGWTADDPNSSTGSYGTTLNLGPYPISGGNLSFTVTDNADAACTDQVTVTAPASCSNQCAISAAVSNIICDDNGTPSDPSDDTFFFDLTVTGNNTGAGWSADDPNNSSGGYGNAVNLGPFPISGGNLSFTVTDNADAACTDQVTVTAPASCSNQCDISATISNISCDDNGTPSDPSDDNFFFDISVSGSNTGSGWTANDPNNSSGSYGSSLNLGPYPISGGDLSFTVTDDTDPACTDQVTVTAPATCSNQCDISATISNVSCNDNGTPSDPSDDNFFFDISVSGTNTGSGWTADDPNNSSGVYGTTLNLGPYPISGGDLNFTITDNASSGCTANVLVFAPPSCSNQCNIAVSQVIDNGCDDNGTPNDPSDDTFSFDLNIVGSNTSSGWTADDPNGTSGNYMQFVTFGPYPISGGDIVVIISDNADPACTTTITLSAPASCSNACSITTNTANILCDDNGTPSDPSDDTFSFDLTVSGSNTGSGWTANDPNNSSGNYGVPVNLGPYPISGGNLSFTVTDNTDPACTDQVSVTAPPPCSDLCDISFSLVNPLGCDDNGTPSDPNDDTFSFEVTITGSNTGTGWTADDPNSTSGNYDQVVIMGPYPISGGNILVTFTDNQDPACTTQVTLGAPPSCSNDCNLLDAGLTGGVCNDFGTPTLPGDDYIDFLLTPSGNNLSGQYIVTSPSTVISPGFGNYGSTTAFTTGPGSAGMGDVTLTITDANDPNCFITIILPDPGSCSGNCSIDATATVPVCDDNGTPSDSSDDTFTFNVTVGGSNTAVGWNADDPNSTTGIYGANVAFGPYPISLGALVITITDDDDPGCTTILNVTPPAACSNACSISASTANVLCSDNGTPSDPNDDTFTFDLTVTGTNTGSGWTANDPNNASGSYGATVNLGPYPISGGNLSFTVSDISDPGCTTQVTVTAPATCSNACAISSSTTNILCDNNGTPTDPSDDTFTFDLTVTGTNTGSGWTANDPNNSSGTYGNPVNLGPYPISGGNLSFTVTDNTDPACTTQVTVTAPATCSNQCDISATVSSPNCNDNGTPSDPSDDTFSFEVTVSGQNTGSGWNANDPNGTAGLYDNPTTFGPYPISGGALAITISDNGDPACTASISVNPPATCSDQCDITAFASNILCDDAGTPSDPSDDTYTFDLLVSGQNTGGGWSANDPNGSSGFYDATTSLGPYLISGGDLNFAVFDNVDPGCTATVSVAAPLPCSDLCTINAVVNAVLCDENGTPADPNDDTFTFLLTVTGLNTGSSWIASDPNASAGLYDVPVILGPYPISGGDLNFTVTDDLDPNCQTSVSVTAPPPCSGQCSIANTISNIQCNDNGTPSDPSDDTFSFDVEVTGSNTGTGWSANDPNNTSGAYNSITSFGPYPISGGDLSFLITDDSDPNCFTPVAVTAPATCSDQCSISASTGTVLCDDNGTPTDPSDDLFTFEITVTGANTGNSWNADDPNNTSGSYNNTVLAGPYPISGGSLNFTITDGIDPGCQTSISVDPPAPCSVSCALTAEVTPANASCGEANGSATLSVSGAVGTPTVSWSSGQTDTLEISGLGTGTYTVSVTDGPCVAADTFDILDPSLPLDTILLSSTSCNPLDTGVFVTVLTDQFGCDSTLIETVSFLPSADTLIVQTLCEGDTLLVNGMVYDENNSSGTDTIPGGAINGCDSIINVNLTFLPNSINNLSLSLCAGDSLVVNGTTYHEMMPGGTEIIPGGAANGCDSIININLTFTDAVVNDVTATLCPGDSLVVNGIVYTQSNPMGMDTIPGGAAAGCDSILNINLTFAPDYFIQLDTTVCPGDTVAFGDTVYTLPGVYLDSLISTAGCDSIVELTINNFGGDLINLVVNNSFEEHTNNCGAANGAISSGSCVGWTNVGITTPDIFSACYSGNTFNCLNMGLPDNCVGEGVSPRTGDYHAGFITRYSTNLEFMVGQLSEPLEAGKTYDVGLFVRRGSLVQYAVNGIGIKFYQNQPTVPMFGEDPDVVTNDVIVDSDNWTEISGEFTATGGELWFAIGRFYEDTNPNYLEVDTGPGAQNGCAFTDGAYYYVDDVFVNYTTYQPGDTVVVSDTICEGNFVVFNGNVYDSAGFYLDTLQTSINGCDSLVALDLNVLPLASFVIQDTICPDSQIVVNGNVYDINQAMGTEVIAGGAANGCDSIITIDLSFLPSCGDSCSILTVINNIICDDNGTPTDTLDDTFTFDLTVFGTNTGSGWSANDPNLTSGGYGVPVAFGPYPIANGTLVFSITDDTDPNCQAAVSVVPPGPCSSDCGINAAITDIECDNNGTESDPGDDTFFVFVVVSGDNTSGQWQANDPNNTSGNYDEPTMVGMYPISGGSISFTVFDSADPACQTTVTAAPPPPCSNICAIDHTVTNILCDDAGTPSDPSDDLFTFEVTVSGFNTATSWQADDPGSTSGAYDVPTLFGPYPIASGQVSFLITDDIDPNCVTFVSVDPPATCSDDCPPADTTFAFTETCDPALAGMLDTTIVQDARRLR